MCSIGAWIVALYRLDGVLRVTEVADGEMVLKASDGHGRWWRSIHCVTALVLIVLARHGRGLGGGETVHLGDRRVHARGQ